MCRGTSVIPILITAMIYACSGQGSTFPGDGAGDATAETIPGADALGDSVAVDPDLFLPDGAPLPDVGGDDAPTGDALGDVPGDLTVDGGEDVPGDQVGDGDPGPEEPWAPCSADAPCADAAHVCLILPDSDTQGVCVAPCTPGAGDCPPSHACVVPDPNGAPEVGYCFLPAGHLEPCEPAAGRVCVGGRYCLAPLGTDAAICTDFCIEDEALCPDLTECAPVSEEGVVEGWGACLPVAKATPCAGDLECEFTEICVTPGEVPSICLISCMTPGTPCSTGGVCELLDGPGGPTHACVHRQGAAEWCDPARGWPCADGRICLDVGDATGFGRCATPCSSDTGCAAHESCAPGTAPDGAAAQGCLPPALAGPPRTACNDAWPCEDPGVVCVAGACAPACGDGCPDNQICVGGCCVYASSLGHACAPGWGWLCAEGAACAIDPGKDGGVCASSCDGDGDCLPGQACLPGPDDLPLCFTPADFAAPCAFSLGIACTEDLLCMTLGSSGVGFCTASCPGIGQGGCPPGPPGTFADCMLNSGGQTWCAFLCGPFGADCPEGMTCDAVGFCLP